MMMMMRRMRLKAHLPIGRYDFRSDVRHVHSRASVGKTALDIREQGISALDGQVGLLRFEAGWPFANQVSEENGVELVVAGLDAGDAVDLELVLELVAGL
jgi:hypothetical protein